MVLGLFTIIALAVAIGIIFGLIWQSFVVFALVATGLFVILLVLYSLIFVGNSGETE